MVRLHNEKREENETVRAVELEWKSQGKRPRGRYRKKWIDVVEDNLKTLRFNRTGGR